MHELKHQGQLRRAIHQEQARAPHLDLAATETSTAAADARKQYEDAQKDARESNKTVTKLQTDLQIETDKVHQLESLHQQTGQVRAQGSQFDLWRATRDAIQSGNATPAQLQQWQSLTHAIATHRASAAQRDLWQELQEQQNAPQDRANQEHWSETGGTSIPALIARGQAAIGAARAHAQTGHGNDSELHDLLNEFLGLAQDVHANSAQRSQLDALAAQVRELRAEVQAHAQRIASGTLGG